MQSLVSAAMLVLAMHSPQPKQLQWLQLDSRYNYNHHPAGMSFEKFGIDKTAL